LPTLTKANSGRIAEDYVRRLAREKAETVAAKYENALVLGADTTVVIENQILGKPKDLPDGRVSNAKMLSGKWHEVLTGVAIVVKEGNTTPKGNPKLEIHCRFAENAR
jgi:septum formation protein